MEDVAGEVLESAWTVVDVQEVLFQMRVQSVLLIAVCCLLAVAVFAVAFNSKTH